MENKHWFYAKDDASIGPLSEIELKELLRLGTLDENTLVWSKGFIDWMPASEVENFKFINSSIELNLVSWNGREPKYDIREWCLPIKKR
jgi:hypothetical protein